MTFRHRRGRPKQAKPRYDHGTPELQARRAQGLTDEPIDLCVKRDLISEEQYHAARRIAWLYRITHGKSWVTALHIEPGGLPQGEYDALWQSEREAELQEALLMLEQAHIKQAVLDCCVFLQPPAFLNLDAPLRRREKSLSDLHKGLDILIDLWNRSAQTRASKAQHHPTAHSTDTN